jgi:hypothetical protein
MKTVLFAAAMLAAVPASAQTYNCHYNYLSGNGYSCNDMNGNGWGVTSNPFNGGWTVRQNYSAPEVYNVQPYVPRQSGMAPHVAPSAPYQSYIPTLRPPPGY